ncbi:MAG: TonB-dependent receptor [Candidatus Hinthialibacter antarcticus]|nr:TonB-dependent receptor [Candidatus Hinthialibacter antarcticus]
MRHLLFIPCLIALFSIGFAFAESETRGIALSQLTELSLEDLLQVEITSVSKKKESVSGAPAAVFVITNEDIRRSGATSIPEALRLAPGLIVARIDSNKWAITSRGFNDRLSNKLLVLIDGRSVYTPLFSGVYWEFQDVVLEDIDRIEVIRGPGATLWGANAVNGVINIITKNARETQGGLVSVGGGTQEHGFGTVRYGGSLGEDFYYRTYLKYFNRDGYLDENENEAEDDWDMLRGGFRADWQMDENDSLTLQGDGYGGSVGNIYTFPKPNDPFWVFENVNDNAQGANFLSRWTREFSEDSDLSLQFFYDYTERDHYAFHERRDILDWDFQHRFKIGERQELVWGLGYRLNLDDLQGGQEINFDPDSRTDQLFSGFVQDEFELLPDKLRLILGSKFEHNDYTGFEIQPNARMVWTPDENHSFWASISRAVRTPSRGEHDLERYESARIFGDDLALPFDILIKTVGNEEFLSEELIAYEIGYRTIISEKALFDATLFFHDYDRLRVAVNGDIEFMVDDLGRPFIELSSPLVNDIEGTIYGFEAASTINVADWMKWKLAYTLSVVELDYQRVTLLEGAEEIEETVTPQQQVSWLTSIDVAKDVELDLWLRYVDEIPFPDYSLFLADGQLADHINLDIRISWSPNENIELSVVGQNLLDSSRREFYDSPYWFSAPTYIDRSVYAKATFRF